MTRADSDSWDIASRVGATATMVAAARAVASREPDAIITDPFAEPLVRAVGLDFFNRLLDGEITLSDGDAGDASRLMTNVMAVRTRFFDDITALSAPGSRLATEYHPDAGASISERAGAIGDRWKEHGFAVGLVDLFYPGERNPVVEYLSEHGWDVTARSRPEVFAAYGRDFPYGDDLLAMRESLAVTAIRN